MGVVADSIEAAVVVAVEVDFVVDEEVVVEEDFVVAEEVVKSAPLCQLSTHTRAMYTACG